MTDRDLFTALRGIDERWILEAAPDEKKQTNSQLWIRWIPAAACFCAIVGLMAGFVVPMLRRGTPVVTDRSNSSAVSDSRPNSSVAESDKGSYPASVSSTPNISTGPNNITEPPVLSIPRLPLVAGNSYAAGDTGFQSQSGSTVGGPSSERLDPKFVAAAVVEAKVIEVLPDSYFLPNDWRDYRIAKLQILDEVNGTGFPEVIYFRFSCIGTYTDCDANVFDGCDSLILSLRQIGIENYLLFNRSDGEAEYFPDMFELMGTSVIVNDVGYGQAIAFRNGVLYESFYDRDNWSSIRYVLEKAEFFHYPATYGSTIQQVKENIRNSIKESFEKDTYDYITKEKLFDSADAGQVSAEVLPGEDNRFEQTLGMSSGYLTVRYTRLIGGFPTEEEIIVRKRPGEPAEVLRKEGVRYTPEDLAAVPDLRSGLEWLKQHLSEIEPEHIFVPEKSVYSACQVNGYYRKADGQVCGIIRIIWTFGGYGTIIQDDCYLLFDFEGYGWQLDRDSLRDLIGDDSLIQDFPYEEYEVPMA